MNTLKMGAIPSEDLQGSTEQSGEKHGLRSHEDVDLNPGSATHCKLCFVGPVSSSL